MSKKEVTRDGYKDFALFDKNKDEALSQEELNNYLNARLDQFGEKVDENEKQLIQELVSHLNSDNKIDQEDMHILADRMWDYEYTPNMDEGNNIFSLDNAGYDETEYTPNYTGNIEKELAFFAKMPMNQDQAQEYIKILLGKLTSVSEEVTRDGYKDFATFDRNNDEVLSEEELNNYLNARLDRFDGKIDENEEEYIQELVLKLNNDGKIDQDDLYVIADTMLQAEHMTNIGKNKRTYLPDDMEYTGEYTGDRSEDMKQFPNDQMSKTQAEDYLKFMLSENAPISDDDKLYLFSRIDDYYENNTLQGFDLTNNLLGFIIASKDKNHFEV